jgi:hypothetical protein
MPTTSEQKVVKIVSELLAEEEKTARTPGLISEKIDLVLAMHPKWRDSVDRAAVLDEVIRREAFWIGQDATLRDDEGHQAWLNAARKRDWRYWQRYREWLERKLPREAVDALDESTDTVLGLLDDPDRDGSWTRRGLVVGHVQSGKTSHYSGLICKAADAGYKIVIVLAGLHNNLRSQTQMRLDEAFLGYKTTAFNEEAYTMVGVGEIDADPAIRPNFATTRSEKGDFNTGVAKNFGITPEKRPWLFVVKKNKTVLTRLLSWIRNHVADGRDQESGRPIVTNLPILVIDDEADHASVDTKEMHYDENGRPDVEHEPTAINRLIRRLLFSFSKSAYVGYTATPFANIFIHEQNETKEEGLDLFPAAFIISLAAPSNYVGPARVFGIRGETGREAALPLVRHVEDYESWMPSKHKNGHVPRHEGENRLPPSLQRAVLSFVLACAIRRVRGQEAEHCSMLVHVTRFTSVQRAVHDQVDEFVRHVRQRLLRRTAGHEELLAALRELWDADFLPTTRRMSDERVEDLSAYPEIPWERIDDALADAAADIQVRMINGSAKDALDYAENAQTGLKVIAIGGEKLSRGLTLEGLTISYFLRASKMYDTLMQMGRWFGYRPGYIDLCRLYTTRELTEWFEHITDAAEELREEFDLMAASNGTPHDYGLKVQSHPTLMVTSSIKMRTARELELSFSGSLSETVTFRKDLSSMEDNKRAAERLLSSLGAGGEIPVRPRPSGEHRWQGYYWDGVAADAVVEFLDGYKSHPEARKANSQLLSQFVTALNREGELTRWTIALVGGGDKVHTFSTGHSVKTLRRAQHGQHADRYSIRRLMSPRDEAIDLDEAAWTRALEKTKEAFRADAGRNSDGQEPDAPNGPAIRLIRPKERGVLFLYTVKPDEDAKLPPAGLPLIGFGISFPSSSAGVRVKYRVNNVYWEQEYGGF